MINVDDLKKLLLDLVSEELRLKELKAKIKNSTIKNIDILFNFHKVKLLTLAAKIHTN